VVVEWEAALAVAAREAAVVIITMGNKPAGEAGVKLGIAKPMATSYISAASSLAEILRVNTN